MNPAFENDRTPSADADPAHYSLEIIEEITGLSSQTILYYQEQGLISTQRDGFDDDTIRTLRRLEHLKRTCEANLAGLKLILALTNEIERLQSVLRARS